MPGFDLDRVRTEVHEAATEDLLDRITVFRRGLEPEAVELIEDELWSRGISDAEVRAHAEQLRSEVLWEEPGRAASCSYCGRPAVSRERRWHRLWGLLPVFPRWVNCCRLHSARSRR
jgi:hypothetical protein